MRRDPELIRKLLLEIEKLDGRPTNVSVEGYSSAEISYHGRLLEEAGLVVVTIVDGGTFLPRRLTNAGHDAVDAVRDEGGWRSILNRARPAADGAATVLGLMAQIRKIVGA